MVQETGVGDGGRDGNILEGFGGIGWGGVVGVRTRNFLGDEGGDTA